MYELKQINPYETPRSPSSRRRFSYFLYGSMIALVLVIGSAAALMFTSVKKLPDNQDNRVFMNRGPVPRHEAVSPSQAIEPSN